MAEKNKLPVLIKKYRWQLATVTVVVIAIIFLIIMLNQPERSVAAYCSVRQEQREKLKGTSGNTYSSALLPGAKSDSAADFASAMAKMERVAPKEVEPNIRVQRLAFEKVADDPSQTMGAAIGAITAEEDAKAWTEQHCGKPTN